MRQLAGLAFTCLAVVADAHPVDEVVQSAYLLVAPGAIRLELDVTPGPAVAGALLRDLDADGDHRFSPADKRAYALRVLRLCALMIDDSPAPWRLDQIGVPSYAQLAGDAATIQLFATATYHGGLGRTSLRFRNGYRPARGPTTANVFAKSGGSIGYLFDGQRRSDDGREFIVSVRQVGLSKAEVRY